MGFEIKETKRQSCAVKVTHPPAARREEDLRLRSPFLPQAKMVGDEGKPEIFKLRLKLAVTP